MRRGPISGRGSATKVMYAKPPTQPFLTWSGLPAIRPRLDGIFWHFRLRSKLRDSRGELRAFRRILPPPTTRRSKPWPTSVSHVRKCPGTTSAGRRFLRALRLRRVSACSPRQFSSSDLGARASFSETVLRVKDLERVKRFYTDVIGLDVLRESDGIAFLKVSDGYGGHTQIIDLFHESLPVPFPKDSRENP